VHGVEPLDLVDRGVGDDGEPFCFFDPDGESVVVEDSLLVEACLYGKGSAFELFFSIESVELGLILRLDLSSPTTVFSWDEDTASVFS
jgi:hypothetical protein